jgi:DNA-binding response OmpR family regulator
MRRLLLIADEVEIRTMMTEVLVNAGYEVDTAETVAMGSALIGRGEYDLVITEGRLPDGQGLRVVRRARDTNTPALIMTAYPLGRPEKWPVLQKPFSARELIAAAQTAIG